MEMKAKDKDESEDARWERDGYQILASIKFLHRNYLIFCKKPMNGAMSFQVVSLLL